MEAHRPLTSKDVLPAVFSRHAEAYRRRLDDIMARGEARGRLRVIEALAVRAGDRVLDLACGPGTLTKLLAARVGPTGEAVGVDLAQGMVDLARDARVPNATFRVMDIEALDLADCSFDAAACGHGLQFVPDLPRALTEARRVLKAGGRFAASVPAPAEGRTPWSILDSVVERRLAPAPQPVDRMATESTLADPARWHAAALAAGFETAEVEIIDEAVLWDSAERLVELSMSWWELAAQLDGLSAEARRAFAAEATAALERIYPGEIETIARNHVLVAAA